VRSQFDYAELRDWSQISKRVDRQHHEENDGYGGAKYRLETPFSLVSQAHLFPKNVETQESLL